MSVDNLKKEQFGIVNEKQKNHLGTLSPVYLHIFLVDSSFT